MLLIVLAYAARNKLVIMGEIRYHVREKSIILSERILVSIPSCHRFPRTPGQASAWPGWTVTRNGSPWLDRAREHEEPPEPEEWYEDYAPLTPGELAEIEDAAADDLLAVAAAASGRGAARASQARRGSSPASPPARRPRSARG